MQPVWFDILVAANDRQVTLLGLLLRRPLHAARTSAVCFRFDRLSP